ncbi:MAG: thiamine-phosphate diphosphorylase [Treponema sp. CETP13]|nr:MAG: thiamine-phosphate diphosphorylase [Treponema sp. CETP13]
MKYDSNYLRLYAVTDRTWLGEKTLAMQVEEALKGGATCIQLREKKLKEDVFLQEAFTIKALCKRYSVPFIINDNVDIAIKCNADGIHVGQSDLEASLVREKIGPKMLLGVSAHTVQQAKRAEECGADYLGVGAVFSTSTKLDANAVSHEDLKSICDAVSIPVVAIGGINKNNIMELAGSGIAGVSVVSAIFASAEIEKDCKKLLLLTDKMLKV